MKDMLGQELAVGDCIAFGKSNRNYPINVGVIESLDYKSRVKVIGMGNCNPSLLRPYNVESRSIKLPESYKELFGEDK